MYPLSFCLAEKGLDEASAMIASSPSSIAQLLARDLTIGCICGHRFVRNQHDV